MPRMNGIDPDQASPATRAAMDRDVENYGYVYPGTGIYGHAPSIQEGARALDRGIGGAGGVSPQLRRLMNIRAATMVGCPF